jgi:succinate dehydrogenase/fumarate reductase cytochrome b subunit
MNLQFNGLLGLVILAADIWAIISIFQSGASNEKKALWVVLVILLPVVGLVLWFFLGPRGGKLNRTL